MANPLHPSALTAAERLDEVAAILATGLRRLRLKNQGVNPPLPETIPSTSTGHQSGHADRETLSKRKSP